MWFIGSDFENDFDFTQKWISLPNPCIFPKIGMRPLCLSPLTHQSRAMLQIKIPWHHHAIMVRYAKIFNSQRGTPLFWKLWQQNGRGRRSYGYCPSILFLDLYLRSDLKHNVTSSLPNPLFTTWLFFSFKVSSQFFLHIVKRFSGSRRARSFFLGWDVGSWFSTDMHLDNYEI